MKKSFITLATILTLQTAFGAEPAQSSARQTVKASPIRMIIGVSNNGTTVVSSDPKVADQVWGSTALGREPNRIVLDLARAALTDSEVLAEYRDVLTKLKKAKINEKEPEVVVFVNVIESSDIPLVYFNIGVMKTGSYWNSFLYSCHRTEYCFDHSKIAFDRGLTEESGFSANADGVDSNYGTPKDLILRQLHEISTDADFLI